MANPTFAVAGACLIRAALASLALFSALAAPGANPPPNLGPAPNGGLSIPRVSFGRDFLMSGSIIPQSTAATSSALAGRIVHFELFSDGVDLYESTDGIVVTKDLPARRLLATFPIVSQDTNRVVVDFNQGMRKVFSNGWLGDDPAARDRAMEVPDSRVFAVQTEGKFLVVRQSVQARDREFDQNREARYEIRYFFSPHLPAAQPGKEQSPSETRYARFFETAPLLEPTTGRPTSKIARFNLAEPVQFYFSANTPAEYVEAVKDGILYWNRAFGKSVVRVDKAPAGVTAPDASRNIIQWVPWDNAGFAYADLLLDPESGESKHGQAYMTSVFGVVGKSRARIALRSMTELADKKDGDKKHNLPALGQNFLPSAALCQLQLSEFAAQYAQGLQDLLASDTLTDAAVLRASQDYVREVVSHEVGHVLGLRHNFAGSLAATLTPRELDDFFKAYLANTNLEAFSNKIATASIMDYNVFKASVFAGWQMRVTTNSLPYDRAAIQWGYFDSKEPVEKKMLFGSDGDVGRYGDVIRFDYGSDPLIAAYNDLSAALRLLPNTLIEQFVAARAPRDPRDRAPLNQVSLNVKSYAAEVANHLQSILKWFQASIRSLKVENQFDFIGDLNAKERAKAHWKSLNDQLDRLGGLDRAAFAFLPLDLKLELKDEPKEASPAEKLNANALTARVEKLLASPVYTNFVGLDEKKYSFTPEEKSLITNRCKTFFEELEKEVVKQVCQRLENTPRDLGFEANGAVADDDAVAKLDHRIIDLARTVILAKNEDQRIEGKVDKSLVVVTAFKFDDETRMAAARMLNDKIGSFRGWATDAKGDLNKALKDEIEAALNSANLREFRESSLSRPLREWYLKQQDLLALLPPKPGR